MALGGKFPLRCCCSISPRFGTHICLSKMTARVGFLRPREKHLVVTTMTIFSRSQQQETSRRRDIKVNRSRRHPFALMDRGRGWTRVGNSIHSRAFLIASANLIHSRALVRISGIPRCWFLAARVDETSAKLWSGTAKSGLLWSASIQRNRKSKISRSTIVLKSSKRPHSPPTSAPKTASRLLLPSTT